MRGKAEINLQKKSTGWSSSFLHTGQFRKNLAPSAFQA
jgi:hypothetical protein